MKLVISTQYYENYGAHDWDGEGQCPQYWKAKGGEEYFLSLEGFVFDEFEAKKIEMLLDPVRDEIEYETDYARSYILGWEVVPDDYMTDFEKSQLEYEGKIDFPAKWLGQRQVA